MRHENRHIVESHCPIDNLKSKRGVLALGMDYFGILLIFGDPECGLVFNFLASSS